MTYNDFRLQDVKAVGAALCSIPDVADLAFATSFYFLNGPRHAIVDRNEAGEIAVSMGSPYGCYNPDLDREELSMEAQVLQDMQILTIFAETVYKRHACPEKIHDHFTMQWTHDYLVTGNKTVSLSQAFGAQIYLDIHHVLKHDFGRGYNDLCSTSWAITQSLKYWRDPWGPKEALCNSLEMLEAEVNGILENSNYEEQCKKEACSCSFTLHMFNPLMCGVTLFKLLHQLRVCGLHFAFNSATIKSAGQFYYACQMHRDYWKSATDLDEAKARFQTAINEKWKEPLVWDDMAALFEMFGIEAFFDGHVPKSNYEIDKYQGTIEDCMDGMGQKTSRKLEGHCGPIMTMPGHGKDPAFANHRITTHEPIAVTHRLFFSKYAYFEHGKRERHLYGWKLDTLQALLEGELKKEAYREPGEEGNARNKSKKKKSRQTTLLGTDGDVSHVTILRALNKALTRESFALRFDFLSFHTTCFRLLSTMRKAIRPLMREVSGARQVAEQSKSPTELPFP